MSRALLALVIVFTGCATLSVRPCNHIGISLTAHTNDDATGVPLTSIFPGQPRAFRDSAYPPAQVRVTAHNGLDQAVVLSLSCGDAVGAWHTDVSLAAFQERDLYFSVPRHEGGTHFFCEITSWRYVR